MVEHPSPLDGWIDVFTAINSRLEEMTGRFKLRSCGWCKGDLAELTGLLSGLQDEHWQCVQCGRSEIAPKAPDSLTPPTGWRKHKTHGEAT